MKKILIIMMMLAPALIIPVQAQKPAIMVDDKPGWHKIGEVTADFKAEKDELLVLGADRFKLIKLKVTDAPIHIAELEVYYENGSNESVMIASDLKAGGETRVIDLKGNSSELKKVGFVYNTMPNSKHNKAHVELYGLK